MFLTILNFIPNVIITQKRRFPRRQLRPDLLCKCPGHRTQRVEETATKPWYKIKPICVSRFRKKDDKVGRDEEESKLIFLMKKI